ncbi:hypothetical protein WGC32_04490 [Zongyangia sp. HA2173]|uniref:hypothetical protein n=1 Tax=Zongyangia sp. HA2173 TaxID=3133035 RepID=UPI00316349B6
MNKKDLSFWALVISFVFGVSLRWPVWIKLITIVLSGMVLVQVSNKLLKTFNKKV